MQGDKILESKPHSLPWRESIRTNENTTTATIAVSIYTCDSQTLPSRRTDNVKRGCIIKTSQPIAISHLKEYTGADGQTYKEVHYDLEVSVIGVALEFSIMYNGERVGHSQLQAEVQDSVHSEPFPSAADELLATARARESNPALEQVHAVVVGDYTAENDEEHSVMVGEWVGVSRDFARRGWAFVEKNGVVRAVPAKCILLL